jgi:MFS family permease
VALFFVGAVPGSICLSKMADTLGRKRGLILANLAIMASAGLEVGAKFVNKIEFQ